MDDKSKREKVSLESTLKALKDREAQYETTLDQDEALVAAKRGEDRAHMAVLVRRGEKRLLREAQSWVQERLDKLHASNERDGGPAPKRQKTRA